MSHHNGIDGWLVHYRDEPGKAICEHAYPGDCLTTDRGEVSCKHCLEWMHA